MFKLSGPQLDSGFEAIRAHGYGSFFPYPPEFSIIESNWPMFRQHLETVDLDVYHCYESLSAFVPKSRLNVRWVSLLHPFDLIMYTALVMALRDDISAARIPAKSRRVFSYRSENAPLTVLYKSKPTFGDFRRRQSEKSKAQGFKFVAVADIADFYSRIYQHRLKNTLLATVTDLNKQDVIRVLEKILFQFSKEVSYGIPVGPAASRPLGEAILIDVDSALTSFGADFIRYVDDFVVFARTEGAAEACIHFLGETLFRNHGLTLQTAKTNVFSKDDFKQRYLVEHSEKEQKRRELLQFVRKEEYDDDAGPSYEELDDEERATLDAYNLTEMLTEALDPDKAVDYSEVSFILGRLSALQQPELIPIVLRNIPRLYPVAHSIVSFFESFDSLPTREQRRIAKRLLSPLLSKRSSRPPVYYAMWILQLFYKKPAWNHADDLLKIFLNTQSQTVQRYAALSLSVSGSRAHAVAIKDYITVAPPLLRTAILLASKKLGSDERKFWIRSLTLTDPLEKQIARA